MSSRSRNHAEDLRGLAKLVAEATRSVTDTVETMHGTIGGAPARLFSAPVYWGIRRVTSAVHEGLEVALSRLGPLLGEGAAAPERELVVAALNGVLGDYLAETNNPLALEMHLRRSETTTVTPNLLVFVHGSSMNGAVWRKARDLGMSAVHLEYNSGLHVSTNARAFDLALEELVATWPVPVESITMVAHSMGGLVARGACHYAEVAGHGWRERLRSLVFIGTPHHGAPLERAGNWLEVLLGVTRYSAPLAGLARIRSAGVTDLRFGYVLDEDWQGRDRFAMGRDGRTKLPLPRGVACFAIAAEKDGLVPLGSAMGDHPEPERSLGIELAHRFVAKGRGHVDVLASPEVWDQLARWLTATDT